MENLYNCSSNATRIVKPLFKLTLTIMMIALLTVAYGQSFAPLVNTSPAMIDNIVTINAGAKLSISIPNTQAGQVFRVQRTFPVDNSFLLITSSGGTLNVPSFPVNAAGTMILTVMGTGDNTLAYSFKVQSLAAFGNFESPEKGNLFPENDGPAS
ncbi:MAG: hypothetical protein IPH45_17655 [Bacteroidales bacterium]|nr:hypothetical protein [Bacteroidales bacterium]